MVGVLMIISLLFAASVPLLTNVVETQRIVDERTALKTVAATLKTAIEKEQYFPNANNETPWTQIDNDDTSWWKLVSRNGGGSAAGARYPIASKAEGSQPRKLFYAPAPTLVNGSFEGGSFFQVTQDGEGWLQDPRNPRELRILLLSTNNSDLLIPNELTPAQFENFWSNWFVNPEGNVAWSSFGLAEGLWRGRASELILERVDLRELVCEARIANRQKMKLRPGSLSAQYNEFQSSGLLGQEYLSGSLYVSTEDQSGTVLSIVKTTDSVNASETLLDVIVQRVGSFDNFEKDAVPVVKVTGTTTDTPFLTREIGIEIDLLDYAPVALVDSGSRQAGEPLEGWTQGYENFYFLKGQTLLFGSFSLEGDPIEQLEYALFERQTGFRYDGLSWQVD